MRTVILHNYVEDNEGKLDDNESCRVHYEISVFRLETGILHDSTIQKLKRLQI